MKERHKFLGLSSAVLFLLYYTYDVPAAINTSIQMNGNPINAQQLALLYTSYSIPNIIMPYIFSKISKRLGNHTIILLISLVLIGQLIFISGLHTENLKYALLGRIFFGIGTESFFVYISNKISQYYIGNELAVVMGTFIAIGRLGTVFTFLCSPLLVLKYSIGLIYKLVGVFTVLSNILMYILMIFNNKNTVDNDKDNEIAENKTALNMFYTSIFLFGTIWAPFYNVAPMMFQRRFLLDKIQSSKMLSYIEASSIFLEFFIGFFVDYWGYKLFILVTSGILMLLAHMNFFLKILPLYVSIGLLALSAPMIACYWPCIPKIVSGRNLAGVFGTISCILNTAYTISPLVTSVFLIIDPSYTITEIYSILMCTILIYTLIRLIIFNDRYRIGLNNPEIMKEKQLALEYKV